MNVGKVAIEKIVLKEPTAKKLMILFRKRRISTGKNVYHISI